MDGTLINENIVEARELVKNYGNFRALNGLNVNVKRGRILGLLGPNGSGKTTFIKILAGLLTTSDGSVLINGKKPGAETKAIVSYLPERPYFNSWMRVDQCLDFFEDFYADFDRELAMGMLQDLSIDPTARMRTLSKGTKEKVQLVMVMARRAKLYLLDEPIGGVDPAAREYILKTIIGNYNPEASVIITTHLIADVEDILDVFAFVDKGKIALQGNADATREYYGKTLDELFREVFRCSRNA